jgi:membrane protease YdiL (CAAX protease family)
MLCCLGYLARRANTTVETAFGLRPVRVRRVMLSGLLLFVLATIWMLSILGLLTWLGLKMGPTASGGYMRKAASSFFVFTDVAVWAPLCEELACRGLLYTSLRTRCGITSSTVLTAAIFTSLHNPGTLVEICGHFFPAALFSLWYERTRSLWPNVIAHALHNGMPALYLIATRTCI